MTARKCACLGARAKTPSRKGALSDLSFLEEQANLRIDSGQQCPAQGAVLWAWGQLSEHLLCGG